MLSSKSKDLFGVAPTFRYVLFQQDLSKNALWKKKTFV